MNEISVIQNSQNGLMGAGKYGGLLGFGGYPQSETMHSTTNSPDRPLPSPPNREPERGLWDMHFDRKTGSEPPRDELLPPNREGLAA